MSLIIPKNYDPHLSVRETQEAIKYIRDTFQKEFGKEMNLERISAPLFVEKSSGLNDNLNGVERPVQFDIAAIPEETVEVVHSLAKWKRMALHEYKFKPGEGLYTNMNAIRRDEELDNLHSCYVDQWDWEKVITWENRNLDFLKLIVSAIVRAVCNTNDRLRVRYPQLKTDLTRDVSFITSQELEDAYPELTPSQRENVYCRQHRTTCIMQIGGKLASGKPHDGRAPDYDDWDLNCDIFFWDDILDRSLEISSMGIRVDAQSLDRQLHESGCDSRRELPFHKMLLNNELPLTVGGGIGQSRLAMLILGCAHIGEVQSSIWDDETIALCHEAGIPLL